MRKKRRLRVTLTTAEDGVMQSKVMPPKEDDLCDLLEEAQEEAFDEEIFAAVSVHVEIALPKCCD
jgi:hypothetical protein